MKDLISRSAIKYEQWSVGPLCEPLMVVRKKTIDSIPAVDAVGVVHAKWKKFGIDYKHEASLYECSACWKIVRKYWEDERFECCPYCFARMDGE